MTRRIALLVLCPALVLAALDRAIVHWGSLWAWAAREVPHRIDDPYRVEALLRTIPPGRGNVLVLGNSRADDSLDLGALEQRFAPRELRFWNLTVAGSGVVEYAMLAAPIARLEPRAAILMVHPAALRPDGWSEETFAYDAASAARVFTARELVGSTSFQLTGLAGELHVLARHRESLQASLLVWLGRETFDDVAHVRAARVRADVQRERRLAVAWTGGRVPESFDGPNLRALDLLAERLRGVGARLIVVEAPSNPVTVPPAAQPRLQRFRGYLSEHARSEGFDFVPGTRFPVFGLDDFRDRVHASASGRARYTATIGQELERLLAD